MIGPLCVQKINVLLIKRHNCHLFNRWFRGKPLVDSLNFKSYSSGSCEFLEQSVEIKTCGNLYRKWREQKLYPKVPKGDLTFNVPFIDTRPNFSETVNTASPTVLALHGAPGSWRDFKFLASYLHSRGCRVIAPSFPDFSNYRPGIFRHSDKEKAQYVKDFLRAISVPCLDLLVCHSSATYAGLILCMEDESEVKSLCLLNPGTFNLRGMRATRNFTFLQTLVKASENAAMLKFMEMCGPFILRYVMKVPVRFESVLDPILSATCMMHGHITESKEKFKKISQKLPMLFIFSENDPLISKEPSYQLAECLGASPSDIFIYDRGGNLIQKGKESPQLKVVAFQQGSHYVFLKHPELVHKEIADFMKL